MTKMDKLLPWTLAVACGVCAFWLGQRYLVTTAENRLLRDQKSLSDVAFKTADTQLQAERILSRRMIESAAGQPAPDDLTYAALLPTSAGTNASGVVVWNAKLGEGMCVVAMPAAAGDRRFQLWITRPKRVDAGTFTVGADGRARFRFKPGEPVEGTPQFAVSAEGRHDEFVLSSD
jgi:hypothetical protein